MQRNHVALLQHLLECRKARPQRARPLVLGGKPAHAESLAQARHLLTQSPVADDAQSAAVKVA